MSYRLISMLGAVVMGIASQSLAYSAEGIQLYLPPKITSEELIQLMRSEGVRLPLNLEEEPQLLPLLEEAIHRAHEVDPSCEAVGFSKIYIQDRFAGFEAYATCEDAPSPAVAIYFDRKQTYLGNWDPAS